jgi:hypothetical protein
MTWLDALKVGIAQCFALIPGTSRSGATIIGGMLFGLSRKAATEFFVLPRGADADCGRALRPVEAPRDAVRGRRAGVRRRLGRVLHLRLRRASAG